MVSFLHQSSTEEGDFSPFAFPMLLFIATSTSKSVKWNVNSHILGGLICLKFTVSADFFLSHWKLIISVIFSFIGWFSICKMSLHFWRSQSENYKPGICQQFCWIFRSYQTSNWKKKHFYFNCSFVGWFKMLIRFVTEWRSNWVIGHWLVGFVC